MLFKNTKISWQLQIGFTILILFVIILGLVSFFQTQKIHLQTEIIYDHPLKVRRALGELKFDIISIHRCMKDILLTDNENDRERYKNQIAHFETDADNQIGVLYSQYLGPISDVDSVKYLINIWHSTRETTLQLFKEGKFNEAKNRTLTHGPGGKNVGQLLEKVQKISDFALNKSDELFKTSQTTVLNLHIQLLILIIVVLLFSITINYIIISNIKTPVKELLRVTKEFKDGHLHVRSRYKNMNEFGTLSEAFNGLASNIQESMELNRKAVEFSAVLMSEDDAGPFFNKSISKLAELTGSQMAAVYLLSDDEQTFEYFASTGLDAGTRKSFDAAHTEGEFGLAVTSGKMVHINNIQRNTNFIFNTVTGNFIPSSIITLPVNTGNKITAVVSIASLKPYNKDVIELLNLVRVTFSTRVEGILGIMKIKEFSKKLEIQNSELESQKTELDSQKTELSEQNRELEVQKNQLDEASRLKTNFLANMSHELRTPLNSVIALSGVLNRRLANKIPDDEYSYIEVIERNGKHLLSLINDILDISRIEAGREDIEIGHFNVSGLVNEVISLIHPQAEQKNIQVVFKGSETPISIASDYKKCMHILQNLIGNAVKFTENGMVTISVSMHDKYIQISVADTGIGISQKHLPHIFDEFRQADGSTSRRYGGTGLGLAIARKYAVLLGGHIRVTSIPNQGSEFILTLPQKFSDDHKRIAVTLNDSLPSILSKIEKPVQGNEKRILLIEDSEPAIIQVQDFIETHGYIISVARNGEDALQQISVSKPDAIILDLMMPGMDGFEVLKKVRDSEQTSQLPILILTAKHITKEELAFLKQNNIHELIQKGDINQEELLSAIANMVNKQSLKTKTSPLKIENILKKPVVLIVEDNPDNMLTAKALLADNYIVYEAGDGKTGVEMAISMLPDVILMDIALPEMDGITAFKMIRNNAVSEHIPVIALTASAMVSDRETILSYGFDGYISKPIDEKPFYNTIKNILYGNP